MVGRLAVHVVAWVALMVYGGVALGATPYVYEFETNYSNWRDQTYGAPNHAGTGGNPDGHFQSHLDADPFFYPYDSAQAGASGPLVGDLWSKYADTNNEIQFTVDVKVVTPGVTVTRIEYTLAGTGDWRFNWFGEWTSKRHCHSTTSNRGSPSRPGRCK